MSIRFLAALVLSACLLLPVPPASAATYTFTAPLSGANEDPPNPSPATGFARVVLDTLAHTLEIHAQFSGLVAPTTAAHIHAPTSLPFAGNVGVAVQVPSLTGFPAGVTEGTYLWTFLTTAEATYAPSFLTTFGFGDPSTAETALLDALIAGRAYFNIHTTAYPGGEIRGFLRQPAPIPLPAALPLFLTALAGFALTGWRRRR